MSEEIIPKKTRTISFSEYSSYISCPHKWYLNYVLKLPGDTSEELIFGSSVHNTIESFLTNKHIRRLYTLNKEKSIADIFTGFLKEELEKITDQSFLEMFEKRRLAVSFLYQAKALILQLDFFNKFKDYEIYDVELKLDKFPIFENGEVIIYYKGFVDLILRHKITGKLLIVDWKTSKKAWDIAKKMKENSDFFAQLCLYKSFLSKIKNVDFKDIGTKFYNLPREEPKKQSFYEGILNETYVDSFIERFTNTAQKIYLHSQSLENFHKAKHISPKNYCFRCKFNTPELCNDVDEFQKIILPSPVIAIK